MKRNKFVSILFALSFTSLTIASCDVTIGSSNQESTFVVTFNPNNGQDEFSVDVKEMELVSKPADPVYANHSFEGWFNSYDELWDFESYKVTENMTLTAKWSEISGGGNQDSSGNGNQDSTGGSDTEYVPDGDVLTVAEALSIAKSLDNGETTTEKYYVEGTMNDIYNSTYGNCHLVDGTSDIIVYGLYSSDGSVRYDSMDVKPVEGDKVIVYGPIMNYYDTKSSVNKYEIVDGWLMSINGTKYEDYQGSTGGNTGGDNTGGNTGGSGDIIVDVTEGWTNTDFGSYYNSVNFSSSDLLGELQKLNSQKRTSTVGYQPMRYKFNVTDYDPNNKNNILSFYSGKSISNVWDSGTTWNREHVWPNSHGGNLVEDDIHVIRPTAVSDNSNRGNSFYVEGKTSSTSGWDPYAAGLTEQYRGQAARIIFYCCVASSSLKIVDQEVSSSSNTMGKLSDLLKWNLQYGVAQTELNRNNGAEDLQGNRNPFIDNPKLACSIWGNTNSETKKICSGYTDVTDPDNGTEQPSDPSIENPDDSTSNTPAPVEGTWTLVTSASDLKAGDKFVIAESKNNKVAGKLSGQYLSVVDCSISNGKITALPTDAEIFTLGGSSSAWTLTTSSGKLLGATTVKKLAEGSGTTSWTISIENSLATIQNKTSTYGRFLYNTSAPRFTTYTSDTSNSMLLVSIYKLN